MINTCIISENIKTLVLYSHLIPIFFVVSLALLVFVKAKRSILSKIFLSFSLVFSLWLLGDLVTWTSNNYYLIYAAWSPLPYIEIIFYILGLYFVMVFSKGADIGLWKKILLFVSTLVPFFITVTLKAVTGFNYPVCEAFNNSFLDQYKLYLEILILAIIFVYILLPFFKKGLKSERKSNLVVIGSMFLSLSVFGVTEYISSLTGYYELNLYSLFIIPVFLIAIIYSIFRLDIFNLRIVSTYFLVFGFLILTASQLLFVTNSTNRILTLVTLILSGVLSYLLFKNLKRESDQRVHIENLSVLLEKSKLRLEDSNIQLQDANDNLKTLLKQRESLVHLVTHKVKGSFTRSKYIFAEMLEGTFGKITAELKDMAKKGLDSDNQGIETVDLVLNAANLQTGTVKYDLKEIDFKELFMKAAEELRGRAESKGLKYEIEIKDGNYKMLGDEFWLKEVVHNFIDNAVKYTLHGSIAVCLDEKDKKILFHVKDTGVGITDEDKQNLFTEGGRGKESVKINVDSTGYGLYTVKLITEAHKGKIWAESEGHEKGAEFFAEFDAI